MGKETVKHSEVGPLLDELRSMAHQLARRQGPPVSTTQLVHSALRRMCGGQDWDTVEWENRAHFFGSAYRAMRSALVDEARRQVSQKRGALPLSLDSVDLTDPSLLTRGLPEELLLFEELLEQIERRSARDAQIVQHRVLGGLTLKEIAELLDVSERTIARRWLELRVWLRVKLTGEDVSSIREGSIPREQERNGE